MVTNHESPFDILASEYDVWFEREGKPIFDIEVEAFQKLLPLLPKPWLEVGVGSGRFAQALGIETGIDPSVKLLEIARERGITGYLARGEDKFFDADTFGTVFLIVTLCFADSPMDVLREAHHILKEGGRAVLGLVLKDSPWGKYYRAKKKEGHRFYQYATFYSYREVSALLEHSGFIIEKVISTLFQQPGAVSKMESSQDGFHPGAGFTIIVADKVKIPERDNPGR